jgi:hypothetical protein
MQSILTIETTYQRVASPQNCMQSARASRGMKRHQYLACYNVTFVGNTPWELDKQVVEDLFRTFQPKFVRMCDAPQWGLFSRGASPRNSMQSARASRSMQLHQHMWRATMLFSLATSHGSLTSRQSRIFFEVFSLNLCECLITPRQASTKASHTSTSMMRLQSTSELSLSHL